MAELLISENIWGVCRTRGTGEAMGEVGYWKTRATDSDVPSHLFRCGEN